MHTSAAPLGAAPLARPTKKTEQQGGEGTHQMCDSCSRSSRTCRTPICTSLCERAIEASPPPPSRTPPLRPWRAARESSDECAPAPNHVTTEGKRKKAARPDSTGCEFMNMRASTTRPAHSPSPAGSPAALAWGGPGSGGARSAPACSEASAAEARSRSAARAAASSWILLFDSASSSLAMSAQNLRYGSIVP
jgi:hypothetical protein